MDKRGRGIRRNCGTVDQVELAIVKIPADTSTVPYKGAIHVALGGWSQSSTNFVVGFGALYKDLYAGYDLLAIGMCD